MGPYDFILNLSALKHVRSEKDPYTKNKYGKCDGFENHTQALLTKRHTGRTKCFWRNENFKIMAFLLSSRESSAK